MLETPGSLNLERGGEAPRTLDREIRRSAQDLDVDALAVHRNNGRMVDKLTETRPLGNKGIRVPRIIFGTSALGNLYQELPYETKKTIAQAWFDTVAPPVVLDSAGKYGAGLALETMGRVLRDLRKSPEDVLISNKLGWKRVPLTADEPQFEKGVWKGIRHDAEQAISYDGILGCFEQGNKLLGHPFRADLLSVHDPDEYLAAGDSESRLADIMEAYRALSDIRERGGARAIGVGAKDWTVIREIHRRVQLDWVMFACSLTVHTHPPELVSFMEELAGGGVGIINSAVFNSGFLIGGQYFDYRRVDPVKDRELIDYRDRFLDACRRHSVDPASACVEFGLSVPGTAAVALNTSKPHHIEANANAVRSEAPKAFWKDLKDRGLIRRDYPYL